MQLIQRLTARTGLLAFVAVLLITGISEGVYQAGTAERAEHLYSDLWHRLAGKRAAPEHVALVMIDDASLAALPDEPLAFWTPHFAKAIDVLQQVGAKGIALDFLFSGSPERWMEKLRLGDSEATRSYDQAFRRALNSGQVQLAAFRAQAGGEDALVLPSPDYLLSLPEDGLPRYIGLTNLRADADGVVRRFITLEPSSHADDGTPQLTFSLLAAIRASGQDPAAGSWTFAGRHFNGTAETAITYAGPPGSFKALSFQRLLRKNAARDPEVQALAGKVVIIGAGYAGGNDVHPTPYSTTLNQANALMAGPELQANIVETLLAGRFIAPLDPVLRVFVFLAAFSLLGAAGLRVRMGWVLGLSLLLMAGAASLGFLLFRQDILFPVAHLQIGLLATTGVLALLRLTREERERSRIGAMFARYLSPQLVEAMVASPELPELGGKAMQVSVLFSDIRNFTTISEQLTPREVVEMLNAYFEQACAALLAEGATIDKFIGDAIMAEFGAPVAQADHARRALRAAVELRRVATEFRGWMQQRFADRDLPPFDIGIGIHSGEAVVGNIGSTTRMEYTAIGDTVNTASRLEGMTKETGAAILASAATLAAAGPDIAIGGRHLLKVKGRVQPVEACEVLGA